MKTERKRIQRSGVCVGSSDRQRASIARQGLQASHERFVESPRYIELSTASLTKKKPTKDCMVYVWCIDGWVKAPWSLVEGAGYADGKWKY